MTLSAYYNLDEVSGTMVTDFSGNSETNGTYVGGTPLPGTQRGDKLVVPLIFQPQPQMHAIEVGTLLMLMDPGSQYRHGLISG